MAPLEQDDEVKEGKGLKFFNPKQTINQTTNNISTKRAGNNSKKQKILYLLHQNSKITKKVYDNFIKSL